MEQSNLDSKEIMTTLYTVEKLKNDFILVQDMFGDIEYNPYRNMFKRLDIAKFINDVMYS